MMQPRFDPLMILRNWQDEDMFVFQNYIVKSSWKHLESISKLPEELCQKYITTIASLQIPHKPYYIEKRPELHD